VGWLLLTVSIADWVVLRRGYAPNPPSILAVLVAATVVAFIACLAQIALRVRARLLRPGPGFAEACLVAGVLVALVAGSVNWLLSLQGFVILHEGESVALEGGTQLQVFEAGPMARLEEMELFLALDEVELASTGDGGFYPASNLVLRRGGGEPRRLRIDPENAAADGNLRFYQGAFGFAPHIVIVQSERTVFERVVPFMTRLHGPGGISFSGRFSVESDDLEVEGAVELSSLDDALRGHATLTLRVARQGAPLGRGNLALGHFAELEQDYQVGFAGLERWSEIDVSRRNYREAILAGGILAVLGALAWPVAWWFGR
jgi:hypothetical protein